MLRRLRGQKNPKRFRRRRENEGFKERPGAAGHGDPRWLEAVVEQAGVLSHTSNLFHTAPQVRRGAPPVKETLNPKPSATPRPTGAPGRPPGQGKRGIGGM